jgi:peptidoglycan-N-acetylglucosamine deacetylase
MISVVVPAYNEEKYLPQCLESLRDQDYSGDYEIIVADNASTDGTALVAASRGARVISCREQQSVFYARQCGADVARGDIIAQADADTIYPRDWLSRIAGRFAQHPEVVGITGCYHYSDPPKWAGADYFLRHAVNIFTIVTVHRPLWVSGATFAFRRKPFQEKNGYHDLAYSPDQYGISTRLSEVGKIAYDHGLVVLTSSRRIQKPLFFVVLDFRKHLGRWLGLSLRNYSIVIKRVFAGKPRRKTARSNEAATL